MTSARSGPFRSGSGRMCLDFVRTLRHRGGAAETEELPDRRALDAWIDQFGPWERAPRRAAPGQDALARDLREAVHRMIVAARGPDGVAACPAAARRTVNAAAALPVPAPRLDASGGLGWRAEDPAGAVLALVARDALDLVASAALGRVRTCAGSDCRALFVDDSRPGTRRWCSMNTCGNKAKKEALRERTTGTGRH